MNVPSRSGDGRPTDANVLSRKRLFASLFSCLLAIVSLNLPGCITHPANPAATQPVTHVDARLADPQYWLSQPAIVQIPARDFYPLWNACEDEIHDRFFLLDREDFRDGVLSTQPMVSKQEFELWRRDAVTVRDVTESSLSTIRRTVWFKVNKLPDGSYTAEPKVLVERSASVERRLTGIYEYHAAFSGPRVIGTAESDEGQAVPTDYWYSTGRDRTLERDLAASITRRLQG